MLTPHFHFLVTVDQDIVLFVKQDDGSILIRNAERSMGIGWKDGVYSAEDARRLWSYIHDYGGRAIDHSIGDTISAILGAFVSKVTDEATTKAATVIASRDTDIRVLRREVMELTDDLRRMEKRADMMFSIESMERDAYDKACEKEFQRKDFDQF